MKTINAKWLGIVASSLPVVGHAAFNDVGTEYTNASQKTYVWNEALEPIELVNSILCFTAQFNVTEFANAGPYLVLADEASCFDDSNDGSTGQSSGAANTPSYLKAVAEVTRASDSAPLIVNVWLPEMATGDDEQAIKFKAVITEGASDTNPFGQFTFNFSFFDNFTNLTPKGGGEVITLSGLEDSIGFTLYESSQHGVSTYTQSASVVMSSDRSEGTALTSSSQSGAYALTFNSGNVLLQNAANFDALPYKSGNNSGTCLSRTQFNSFVYRYDLYNASTGAQIDVNAGFPMKYSSANNGTYDSYGYVGYWGIWTEVEGAVTNGETIVRDDNGVVRQYTVMTAPGRLIKNTVNTLALSNARGISFSYWDSSVFSDSSFDQWVVKYYTAAQDGVGSDGFYKTGKLSWGQNGPTITAFGPTLISLSTNDSLYMYSEQLGGEVKFLEGNASLTYYEQTFINGSETGSGELLNGGSVTLYCYDNCPIGTFDLSDLTNWTGSNSPFETASGPHQYTFSTSGGNALTLVSVNSSEPVRYNASLTQSNINSTPHSWGVRSGPMVLSTVSNSYDVYDPAITTEYYVWETGLQNWNQLTAVKDASDNIVSFEKPLQFAYTHNNANDRSGSAGVYAGQTYLINYGGNGDFWGVPMAQDGDRYLPSFSLNDGVLMGPANQYAIKAREIEQTMQAAAGQCTTLTLSDPAVDVPTSIVGDADIGDMPIVEGDPSVIAGETQ
ncbi:hypothetical protein LRP49_02875 [Enterovibrio sp. ZSDZ35]|uniref:MSHA biogenesis protein MshQ n=1 Tax=Enterovibrio qingdaonensis TaxID=2899818 RepID=A0ABT5QHL4_9GAMM|nr:hypothetical protein [Enterovibrio sp. ZSDZ35]MDD1780134.1 hypothetical protein [Enterovibrio sp. ZSDZ35]